MISHYFMVAKAFPALPRPQAVLETRDHIGDFKEW